MCSHLSMSHSSTPMPVWRCQGVQAFAIFVPGWHVFAWPSFHRFILSNSSFLKVNVKLESRQATFTLINSSAAVQWDPVLGLVPTICWSTGCWFHTVFVPLIGFKHLRPIIWDPLRCRSDVQPSVDVPLIHANASMLNSILTYNMLGVN